MYDDPDALLGERLHDVFSTERADDFLAAIHHVIETEDVQTIEYRLDVTAGARWFEAHLAPLSATDDDSSGPS